MPEVINEVVCEIVTQKLKVRFGETIFNTIICKHREFDNILEEVGIILDLFIEDEEVEEIVTVQDLIDVCERLKKEKEGKEEQNG